MVESATAAAEIKAAVDVKNFPRWAQACPQSFDKLKRSIAQAAIALHGFHMGPETSAQIALIIGGVAATCWAAGRESVREASLDSNGLDSA